jgi:hypothetical protein
MTWHTRCGGLSRTSTGAERNDHVATLELWQRAGLSEAVDEDHIFASVDDAVDALKSRRAPAPSPVA